MTLEDIIEEIIQQEIVDETDVIADNRTKRKLKREGRKGKENIMLNQPEERVRRVNVSPQLTLAVFQYLTTSIEPFKSPPMSDSVLKKLLSLDVFREVKLKKDKTKMNEEDLVIIQKGTAIDYFILIIEGRVEVNIGREELVFESGPFTYFGIQVLNNVMENPASSSGLGAPTNKPVAALVSSQSQGEAITGGGGVGGGGCRGGGGRAVGAKLSVVSVLLLLLLLLWLRLFVAVRPAGVTLVPAVVAVVAVAVLTTALLVLLVRRLLLLLVVMPLLLLLLWLVVALLLCPVVPVVRVGGCRHSPSPAVVVIVPSPSPSSPSSVIPSVERVRHLRV